MRPKVRLGYFAALLCVACALVWGLTLSASGTILGCASGVALMILIECWEHEERD
jgi:hypothetical protein